MILGARDAGALASLWLSLGSPMGTSMQGVSFPVVGSEQRGARALGRAPWCLGLCWEHVQLLARLSPASPFGAMGRGRAELHSQGHFRVVHGFFFYGGRDAAQRCLAFGWIPLSRCLPALQEPLAGSGEGVKAFSLPSLGAAAGCCCCCCVPLPGLLRFAGMRAMRRRPAASTQPSPERCETFPARPPLPCSSPRH